MPLSLNHNSFYFDGELLISNLYYIKKYFNSKTESAKSPTILCILLFFKLLNDFILNLSYLLSPYLC